MLHLLIMPVPNYLHEEDFDITCGRSLAMEYSSQCFEEAFNCSMRSKRSNPTQTSLNFTEQAIVFRACFPDPVNTSCSRVSSREYHVQTWAT